MASIDILKQDRRLFLRVLEGLDLDTMLTIPPGFRNHIAWNLGHVVVTQQALHYRLSRLPMHVDRAMMTMYRTGSSPAEWTEPPDLDEVLRLLIELPDQFERDLAEGRFETFRPYTTSTGIELTDLDDALAFNHFHEGVHLGVILAQRRLLTGP